MAQTLCQRASALFVHQVHFRAHGSLLPIAQSPIRLIVVRSSTPSPTRCLSCGTRAPAESDSDCCQCNFQYSTEQCSLSLLLQSTKLIVARCNHVIVASLADNTKVFDRCICCNGGRRETSFIASAMALLRWWRIAIGAIKFTAGTLAFLWLLLVVAQLLFVARGLPFFCTVYAALSLCG